MVSTVAAQAKSLQDAHNEHAAVIAPKDAEIATLKEEIARLKGLTPQPKFKAKPSGMEQTTSNSKSKKGRKRRPGIGVRQTGWNFRSEVEVENSCRIDPRRERLLRGRFDRILGAITEKYAY